MSPPPAPRSLEPETPGGIRVLDGPMGTELFRRGWLPARPPLEANGERPDWVAEIHASYVDAGAALVTANTFGLLSAPPSTKTRRLVREGIRLAREAARGGGVAASLGPPARGGRKGSLEGGLELLVDQGAEILLLETWAIGEASLCAVRAARRIAGRGVRLWISFAPPRGGRLEAFPVQAYRDQGAEVLGVNCGPGPAPALALLDALALRVPGPFLFRPSAGLPGGVLPPEALDVPMDRAAALGAAWVGVCCGGGPSHIARIASRVPAPALPR